MSPESAKQLRSRVREISKNILFFEQSETLSNRDRLNLEEQKYLLAVAVTKVESANAEKRRSVILGRKVRSKCVMRAQAFLKKPENQSHFLKASSQVKKKMKDPFSVEEIEERAKKNAEKMRKEMDNSYDDPYTKLQALIDKENEKAEADFQKQLFSANMSLPSNSNIRYVRGY